MSRTYTSLSACPRGAVRVQMLGWFVLLAVTLLACSRAPDPRAAPPVDNDVGGGKLQEATCDGAPCDTADGQPGPVDAAGMAGDGDSTAAPGADDVAAPVDASAVVVPVDAGPVADISDTGGLPDAAGDGGEPAPVDGGTDGGPDAGPSPAGDADAGKGGDGGIPPELQGLCPGLFPALPEPGTKCTKKGEVHCTNKDSYPKKLIVNDNPMKQGVCVRPYRVVCEQTNGGGLVWTPYACNPAPPKTNPTTCAGYYGFTCQENARGVRCCPLKCKLGSPQSGVFGRVALCPAEDYEKLYCYSAEGENAIGCGFVDQFPKGLSFNIPALGACAETCKDCTYWWTTEKCKELTCPTGEGGYPPAGAYTPGKCLVEDGKPKCAETCKEAGAPGY